MGAEAFATGNQVAFGGAPSLRTAAHEAAHSVQQRGGVQLKGGVGQKGDAYERHADAVADAVVAGRSAEGLLDGQAGAGAPGASPAIQRIEEADLKQRGARIAEKAKTAPVSGMNLWEAVCAQPPATVFLLGTNHGLHITQMAEWKGLVAFLQSEPFTHVLSETTATFDKTTTSAPADVTSYLESKIKIEGDFSKLFVDGTYTGTAKQQAIAKGKLTNLNNQTNALDDQALDDGYVTMGMTSGRKAKPRRELLETTESRAEARQQNERDLGIDYSNDSKYKIEPRPGVTAGTEDVRTGNQRDLFEAQAQELKEGRDVANAEQRNKQWVDRLKLPENLKEGDRQLWIVGAAHLPGLILRFEDLGWKVNHRGPLPGGEAAEEERKG